MGEGPNDLAAALAGALPSSGRALEIACGEGQLAIWLAGRGMRVDAVDISAAGLAKLTRHAAGGGVADRVRPIEHDLDRGLPVLGGDYQLIACFHFPVLDLLPALKAALAPGGMLLLEVLTRANLARSSRLPERSLAPRGALLDSARDLSVLFYREGIIRGKGQAQLLAARPPAPEPIFMG